MIHLEKSSPSKLHSVPFLKKGLNGSQFLFPEDSCDWNEKSAKLLLDCFIGIFFAELRRLLERSDVKISICTHIIIIMTIVLDLDSLNIFADRICWKAMEMYLFCSFVREANSALYVYWPQSFFNSSVSMH